MNKIVKSDAEWKELLTPMQYRVTRHAATEAPGSGEYVDHHDHGIYTCVCCGTPLFESDTKFDSGSAGRAISRRSTRRTSVKKPTRVME